MKQEIVLLSATELVANIKQKKLSVVEVVTAYLEHIDRVNKDINAISDLRPKEDLLKEAYLKDEEIRSGNATGKLFGVPVTIKESFGVKGLKLTNGDPFLRNNRSQEDTTLIKRLKDEGAIILGVTNIALFSIDWQSVNSWNGTTNNPHDLTRTAGGSSGGSAAAVASHMSPIALGSDAGGSVRVPAHFCGICGFRPTENFITNRGHMKSPGKPQGRRNVITPGPFARNIEDLILMTEVLANAKSTPLSEIPPTEWFQQPWDNAPLKIAITDAVNGVEIDAEYETLFHSFINKISSTDCEITSAHPQHNESEAYYIYNQLMGFENGVGTKKMPFLSAILYCFVRFKYRDHLWAKGMAKGQRLSNTQYAQVIDYKDQFSDQFDAFISEYDVWITPVCAIEAFKHQRAGVPFLINGKKTPYTKALGAYMFTSAFSGHPIAVIPIGKKKNGMPVGIQIHGRKWSDRKVLEIARHFESLL